MATILDRDTEISFPHFVVLKASAGSGKTYALTERFVQFLLSEKIPGNRLKNILAITFSNNAAKEMREEVLKWLKLVSFGDRERLEALSGIVSLDKKTLVEKAGLLIDEILRNYSDFQVRTIDSFMTSVFKTSAIDFGYNPEFEILMDGGAVMDYSFDLFLRNVREGSAEAALFDEIISFILGGKKKDASYLWDPSATLLDEIKKIYARLSSTGKRPLIKDYSKEMAVLKTVMKEAIEEIEALIERSELERNGKSSYKSVLPLVREGRIADLIGKGLATPPVNKAKKKDNGRAYEDIVRKWSEFSGMVRKFITFYVFSFCAPYLRIYEEFSETVERTKKHQGRVFIGDINRYLAEYLVAEIVPEVYFRIGETVFHFLIDEFQDTSPIQWRNLYPLIENSLSQRGSAFVVGDTKQAIYGFRNADYRIMREMETNPAFPSARHEVKKLDTNYRSLQVILDFNEKVFKKVVPSIPGYREAAARSGLTDYFQKAKEGGRRVGNAEVILLDTNEDDPPERQRLQELVGELHGRGYGYGDIAVLAQTNENAVRATGWLNERGIPFISFSSLDVRRRKITGELVALLNFLDSPTDDLSFATFILGDLFTKILEAEGDGAAPEKLREFLFTHRSARPLYKSFQAEFGDLWEKYFSGVFRSAGYFPLYDLVTAAFSSFRVFDVMGDEEATLVKVLEVVKDFEGEGYNSLGDFLEFAGNGDDAKWNMDVPRDLDAVKVMTIHKSKGLGFPVVIILLYEDKNRRLDYILHEERDSVHLLRITKETVGGNDLFERLYREESIKEMVNRLNSLYVGFTRPKEELYVIGVKGKAPGYPIDLLPVSSFLPSDKPEKIRAGSEEARSEFVIRHYNKQIEFPVPTERDELTQLEETRRGEFVHRVLSLFEYAGEGYEEKLAAIVKRARDETGDEYPPGEIMRIITGLVEDGVTGEYFRRRPGRRVWTEKEFSDREGNLFRMDRVIKDSDGVTVIDFKTGGDAANEEKHDAQMKTYMKILAGVYPGEKIEGIISYVDRGEIRRVS
jgi:ATP-dependent helicase/nuclease subunit A